MCLFVTGIFPIDIDSGRPPSELPQAVSRKHTDVVVKSSSTFELSVSLLYSLTPAVCCVCLSLCLRSLALFAESNKISDAGASALAAALQGSQLETLCLGEYLNESL